MTQPWTTYPKGAGYMPDPQHSAHRIWDAQGWPFVVRWSVPTGDRLTRWIDHTREFQTLDAALAAYKRPFKGLSVDLVAYNGGQPGKHLDTLASRRCGKATKWHATITAEQREGTR